MNKKILILIGVLGLIPVFFLGQIFSPIQTDNFYSTSQYLDSKPVNKLFLEKYSKYGKVEKINDSSPIFIDLDYQISSNENGWVHLKTSTWAGFIIFQNITCTPDENDVQGTQYHIKENILEYLQNYNCFEDKYP